MKDDGEVYYLIIQNIPWYVNQIYNLNIKYHWLFSTLILCESRVLPVTLFSSVQFSHSVMFNSLWPHGLTAPPRLPCPSPTPRAYSNSCPSSWWYHPAISSFVVPFSSCPQSLPASGSFPMSQLFAWSGQSIGVSTSASVLPMNT